MEINTVESIPTYSLEAYRKKREELNDLLQHLGQEAYLTKFQEFFVKYPKITKVGFHAYTPFFNDGDACEYSVHDYYFYIPELDSSDIDWEDQDIYDWCGTWNVSKYDSTTKTYSDLPGFEGYKDGMSELYMETSDEELCKSIYGDHVQVIVTPFEIQIEDYDHD